MDVKQFKELKENLNQKLYTVFRGLIQGGTVQTVVHDDLENLELVIIQEKKELNNNNLIVETKFYYNIKIPDNLKAKLNSRIVLISPGEQITGVLSDYSQIDLDTISVLREHFYNFAVENNLIDEPNGAGVGRDERDKPTL
jgi:hypothetical protein